MRATDLLLSLLSLEDGGQSYTVVRNKHRNWRPWTSYSYSCAFQCNVCVFDTDEIIYELRVECNVQLCLQFKQL